MQDLTAFERGRAPSADGLEDPDPGAFGDVAVGDEGASVDGGHTTAHGR